eukprot:5559026-Pleurochrysis_carterae.AAC.1
MSVTQLLFDTAYLINESIDAIDGEMAEASVNKTNLPPRTLDRIIFAGHRVHEGVRSERDDGVVRGALADADVVVIQ